MGQLRRQTLDALPSDFGSAIVEEAKIITTTGSSSSSGSGLSWSFGPEQFAFRVNLQGDFAAYAQQLDDELAQGAKIDPPFAWTSHYYSVTTEEDAATNLPRKTVMRMALFTGEPQWAIRTSDTTPVNQDPDKRYIHGQPVDLGIIYVNRAGNPARVVDCQRLTGSQTLNLNGLADNSCVWFDRTTLASDPDGAIVSQPLCW